MKAFLVVVILSVVLNPISGQITVPGSCPAVSNWMQMDWEQFTSIWFEQRRFPTVGEDGTRCNMLEFYFFDDYIFEIKEYRGQLADYAPGKIVGPNELRMGGYNHPIFNDNYQFWIMETDYNGYAVAFSCNQVNAEFHLQNAWILTREKHPHPAFVDRGIEVLLHYGVNINQLIVSDQSDCPSFY